MSLDDGLKRLDSVKDVGAILDWIETAPQFDHQRTGIFGGSYGGFMVLAALTSYPDRFRAGCDLVGMSNLLSFLERTRGYRRENRRNEYGDERDPNVREFLQSISPLHRAEDIRTPLFVAHGATDPRVPLFEAEQIARAVETNNVPMWMFVAEDEGHGFKRRQNRDMFYKLLSSFLYRYLQEEPLRVKNDDEILTHPETEDDTVVKTEEK